MSLTRASTYAPATNRFRSRRLGAIAAAGAGCALVSVARAQIVYSGIQNRGFTSVTNFDFDGNSVTDLYLYGKAVSGGPGFAHSAGTQTGQVVLTGSVLDKLAPGEVISSASTFSMITGNTLLTGAVGFGSSDWGPPAVSNTGYFGFSFTAGASTYYGWGQASFTASNNGKLIDWAYNSVAGERIAAGQLIAVPEPATTAMLMSGLVLAGAAWWKRRRRAGAGTPNAA